MRDILAIFLVGRLGCQRQSGDAAVVVAANLSIVAEKADEVYFVLIHGDTPFLNFPILLGSHRAEPSEWARLPSAKSCFLGGRPLGRNHDLKGGAIRGPRRTIVARWGGKPK